MYRNLTITKVRLLITAMAFSDYKNIAQAQKKFQIKYQEEKFIDAQPFEPPTYFVKELEFYKVLKNLIKHIKT